MVHTCEVCGFVGLNCICGFNPDDSDDFFDDVDGDEERLDKAEFEEEEEISEDDWSENEEEPDSFGDDFEIEDDIDEDSDNDIYRWTQ